MGIHGARLGAGYTTTFWGMCFVPLDGSVQKFFPEKAGCHSFLDEWYDITMEATSKAFDLLENAGVSPQLRTNYFSMEDDPAWPGHNNVLRKPDWILTAQEALEYALVTRVGD